MKARAFEFRHRSLLNLIHFWIAFQLYSVDHRNVVWAVVGRSEHGVLLLRVVLALGALLVALAAAIRTWAAAYLRSSVVHDPTLHAEALVADGPYRHVRNPLYLGTFLMSIGLGLLASRSGFVVLALGAAIRILRLIGREEAELAAQQGEVFREFCRRVPRLWPSLRARIPASGAKALWGQAFRGEAHLWGFFITMLAFAVTLDRRVLWILGGASLGLWLLARAAERLKPATA
ncbi:MAG TPA: isoprenylcysteine carboxylmethyltransferase family protein [Candidatus Cybelea sp.]|nr:isoprenylcysteine carboxylmethyltransferase family protein [Candidatus Cybelea sp.]